MRERGALGKVLVLVHLSEQHFITCHQIGNDRAMFATVERAVTLTTTHRVMLIVVLHALSRVPSHPVLSSSYRIVAYLCLFLTIFPVFIFAVSLYLQWFWCTFAKLSNLH